MKTKGGMFIMTLEDYKLVDELIEESIEDADMERMMKLQRLRMSINDSIMNSEARNELLEYQELQRVKMN